METTPPPVGEAVEEGEERATTAVAAEITEGLPGLSVRRESVAATHTAQCETVVANQEQAGTQEDDQDTGLCLSEHAMYLLWDQGCNPACAGRQWQAQEAQTHPDIALPSVQVQLQFAAQHTTVLPQDCS